MKETQLLDNIWVWKSSCQIVKPLGFSDYSDSDRRNGNDSFSKNTHLKKIAFDWDRHEKNRPVVIEEHDFERSDISIKDFSAFSDDQDCDARNKSDYVLYA